MFKKKIAICLGLFISAITSIPTFAEGVPIVFQNENRTTKYTMTAILKGRSGGTIEANRPVKPGEITAKEGSINKGGSVTYYDVIMFKHSEENGVTQMHCEFSESEIDHRRITDLIVRAIPQDNPEYCLLFTVARLIDGTSVQKTIKASRVNNSQ